MRLNNHAFLAELRQRREAYEQAEQRVFQRDTLSRRQAAAHAQLEFERLTPALVRRFEALMHENSALWQYLTDTGEAVHCAACARPLLAAPGCGPFAAVQAAPGAYFCQICAADVQETP